MRTIIDFVETVLAGLLILVLLILNPLLRRWTNRWGARDSEVRATLPGDERTPNARFAYTRAISIRAALAQVWPWLIQIGQDKGGLYSYEMLENLIGCQMDCHPATFANAFMWCGLMEPMNFVMEQKMLRGIKTRAEAQLCPAVARAQRRCPARRWAQRLRAA